MKKLSLPILILFLATLSGCDVITGIFKAGAVTGIVAVVVILILIIWVVSKLRS